ncbi:MAG: hypothetical protein AB2A00_32380 [Myxococcota bacterium]
MKMMLPQCSTTQSPAQPPEEELALLDDVENPLEEALLVDVAPLELTPLLDVEVDAPALLLAVEVDDAADDDDTGPEELLELAEEEEDEAPEDDDDELDVLVWVLDETVAPLLEEDDEEVDDDEDDDAAEELAVLEVSGWDGPLVEGKHAARNANVGTNVARRELRINPPRGER